MKYVAIIALVLFASTAFAAGPTTHTSGRGEPSLPYSGEPVIKWVQAPWIGAGALASQYAANYPFWAESADDFECLDGDPIVKVEWWGEYWGGDPVPPAGFIISFYTNIPTVPSFPGDMIYQEICTDYHETWDTYYEYYKYWVLLDPPFEQEEGMIYWLSVVPILDFPPQWGWAQCREQDYWNDCAVMDFEVLGIPRWTPMYDAVGYWAEMAFVLGGPGAAPVEQTTWGNIKALYQ